MCSDWVTLFGFREVTAREILIEIMDDPTFAEDVVLRDILLRRVCGTLKEKVSLCP